MPSPIWMEPMLKLNTVEEVFVTDIQKRRRPTKHYVFIINVRWQDGGVIPVHRSYGAVLKLQDKLLRIRDFLSNIKDAKGRTKTGALLRGESFFARFTLRKKKQAQRRLPQVDSFLKSVVQSPSFISQSDPAINFFRPLDKELKNHVDMGPEDTRVNLNEPDHEVMKRRGELHSSNPRLLGQYVATSSYTKKEEKDLNLRAGDVVDVIERNEHGWWFVDLEGALGWVPAAFLEPRDGSAEDVVMETFEEEEEETYVAVESYQAKEDGEIGLAEGCLVDVIQKNVDGWWLIRYQGEEGWAPAMFLEEVRVSSGVRRQTSIRRMNRGGLRNSISRVAGRRQTKEPPPRRQRAEPKEAGRLTCSNDGVDGVEIHPSGRDETMPSPRDSKLDLGQELGTEPHAVEWECVRAVPEQEGWEIREETVGLVPTEPSKQNDLSEVTCPKGCDSSRAPEKPTPPETSLSTTSDGAPTSCDVENPEMQSDGSISEDALSESGDEFSDQEVFLEGLVLIEEPDLLSAHDQNGCASWAAEDQTRGEFGLLEQGATSQASSRNTPLAGEEFSQHPCCFWNGKHSDNESLGETSELEKPSGSEAVSTKWQATTDSFTTQENRLESPKSGSQVTGREANNSKETGTKSVDSSWIGVQEICDGNKREELRLDGMDQSVGPKKKDEEKGPPLAVAEDLEDLDDLSD